MKKSILVAAILGVSMSGAVMADDHSGSEHLLPSYDHVELGLKKVEGTGDETMTLEYSRLVKENVFVEGAWEEGLFSSDEFRLGAGYVHTMEQGYDLYGGASLVYVDLPSGSEDGFDVFGGVRYMVNDTIELNAEVLHTDVVESSQLYSVGGRYHMGEFSVSASYGMHGDSDYGDVARLALAWHF